jgi:hypothetical protein
VPDARLRTVDDARAFLFRFRHDVYSFEHALKLELDQSRGLFPSGGMVQERLIDAVAQGIATRAITVASPLGKGPTIFFDEKRPYGGPFDAVGFPNASVAAAFVASLGDDTREATDLARALEHEAGEQWRYAEGHYLASSVAVQTPTWANPDTRPARAATLLATGWLMLLPVGLGEHWFRWAWRPRGVAWTVSEEIAPPPPPQRIPVAIAGPALPRSVLPKAPAEQSPQADAFLEAARRAYPFCEECAERAAARAREAARAGTSG